MIELGPSYGEQKEKNWIRGRREEKKEEMRIHLYKITKIFEVLFPYPGQLNFFQLRTTETINTLLGAEPRKAKKGTKPI